MATGKKKTSNTLGLLIGLGLLIFVSGSFAIGHLIKNYNDSAGLAFLYNPQINPDEFTSDITNKYLSQPVGSTYIYEGQTADGTERTEISVPGETKLVMGVKTRTYKVKVSLDGQLQREVDAYVAQNIASGDVWYFGEMYNNYKDGKVDNHTGSWLPEANGAKPGIIMLAKPKVGSVYRKEYLKGIAENMFTVISVDKEVKTSQKTYQDCLEILDWTLLKKDGNETKWYCPEVHNRVLSERFLTGDTFELVEIVNAQEPSNEAQ